MKKVLLLFFTLSTLISCNNDKKVVEDYLQAKYGFAKPDVAYMGPYMTIADPRGVLLQGITDLISIKEEAKKALESECSGGLSTKEFLDYLTDVQSSCGSRINEIVQSAQDAIRAAEHIENVDPKSTSLETITARCIKYNTPEGYQKSTIVCFGPQNKMIFFDADDIEYVNREFEKEYNAAFKQLEELNKERDLLIWMIDKHIGL